MNTKNTDVLHLDNIHILHLENHDILHLENLHIEHLDFRVIDNHLRYLGNHLRLVTAVPVARIFNLRHGRNYKLIMRQPYVFVHPISGEVASLAELAQKFFRAVLLPHVIASPRVAGREPLLATFDRTFEPAAPLYLFYPNSLSRLVDLDI